jgi:hypothetical protein
VAACAGLKPDAVGRPVPLAIQECVVRLQGGLWEIRLGDRLLTSQATQPAALEVAEALAYAAALRGERWKILVDDHDAPTEHPGRRPLFRT